MKLGIKSKLIITMVTVNCMIATMLFYLSSKSFDEDFLDYVIQIELKKLKPLTQELALLYQQKKGWQWIRSEHGLWRDVLDYHVLKRPLNTQNRRPPPPRRFQGRANPPNFNFSGRPPPPRPKDRPPHTPYVPQVKRFDAEAANFESHILLRDEFNLAVIGRDPQSDRIEWLPIMVENNHVGDVGLIYQKEVSNTLESYFVDQQKSVLATMIIVMLVVAVVLAFILSHKLMHHILLLQKGLSQLVKGEYDKRLTVSSNDELGQLASNFNSLSQTLEKNQQSRQKWIADISHELRTPVAILKGELEALIDGVRKTDSAALHSLHQESDRLALLINDLHELSLSDLGALSYQKENIDIVELVSDFISDQEGRSELKGLTTVFNSDVKNCIALIDADRIEQCFINLMQNTLRYTDLPGQCQLTLKSKGHQIELYWEDSSPGVSDKDMKYLFDRLYRVEKSRNRAKGGAGLGLSICKNILDAHDADVSLFQSKLGGLGFKIIFSKVKL